MANLIITVISIALVAVAALMGAYYGGTAFMDGQVKASANTVIQNAAQIAAAVNIYRASNGVESLPDINSFLVPNYLAQMPSLPSLITANNNPVWWQNNPTTWRSGGAVTNGNIIVSFFTGNNASAVCTKITKSANGESATLQNDGGGNISSLLTKKFDCFKLDGADVWGVAYRI